MFTTLIRKLFDKNGFCGFDRSPCPLVIASAAERLEPDRSHGRNIVIGAEAGIKTRYRCESINIVGVYEFPPARE
jgi:hypothetical protein